jgi:hypothetical protein
MGIHRNDSGTVPENGEKTNSYEFKDTEIY